MTRRHSVSEVEDIPGPGYYYPETRTTSPQWTIRKRIIEKRTEKQPGPEHIHHIHLHPNQDQNSPLDDESLKEELIEVRGQPSIKQQLQKKVPHGQ